MRKLVVLLVACLVGGSFGTVLALNPSDPSDALRDEDGDGLNNLMEFIYGTDPYNPDTDGAGCPDGWEAYYNENRARFPSDSEWAVFDSDDDGAYDVNVDPNFKFDPAEPADETELADTDMWDQLKEYAVGTDPTNPDTDGDGDRDDLDPEPLIPTATSGHHTGGNSGQCQGIGGGALLAAHWDSYL